MTGFKVPSDLADKPLTIAQVREIINSRNRARVVQTRLDGLDDKADGYRKEIEACAKREAEILEEASA